MSFKSRLARLEVQNPEPEIDYAETERLQRAYARVGMAPFEGFVYTGPWCDPAKLLRDAEIRAAQAEQEQEAEDQQSRIIICGPQGCVEG
ncbi:MAG: hypothetical protein P4L39_05560 [Humidesulfovibrio sp.]|nr:hypothetical protein [Humidesulfovibrio sp.]